uniref:Reverse transcriptase domain-containing protein n=1 Tax=Tanacetum cinerariifolium TaxID=118510 RepID=A0A6L2LET0_TANCI|nr:reverse transcriptase domain-containing protein [Tanacetum cinerariifolium]
MRTRNSYFLNNSSATILRRRNKRPTPNIVEPELRTIVEMADNRIIKELLQAPTEGDVPNDVIKLMMFPYSLEGNARFWDNASKSDDRIDKLADRISTLVDIFAKKIVAPTPVKAVEESCVICGGAHAYYNCPNIDSNQPSVCVVTCIYNQVAPQNCASNNMAPPGFALNQSSTSGTILSNTIPNPKGEMKQSLHEVVLLMRDLRFLLLKRPRIKWKSSSKSFQDLHVDISFTDALLLMPKFASTIKSLLTNKDKLFELAKIPLNENCSAMLRKRLLEKLRDPGKFLIPLNRIDIIDVAREEYAQEIIGFSNNSSGGNPTSTFEPILFNSSPSLTPFEGSDFILEEIDAYLKDKSFLGYAGFYRRFIQDFSKIAKPMTHLLEKETSFVFSKDCIDAFETLKKKLTEAPILVVPDWNLPFELMCDASDFAIGVVLGQRKTKHFNPIHYASKTMTEAQIHYTTTKKEMLDVVYAFEKFRPYLVLSKSIVYTDHLALKYLLSKTENLAVDHLSRLENPHKDVFENKEINENFPLETLGKISSGSTPWFADFKNFHARNFIVKGMSSQQKKKFFKDVKHYFWDDPYLF